MLIIALKNNTGYGYDSIRRAAKNAFKSSAAYRQYQVMFDDAAKASNILAIKIGDPANIDLVMHANLDSIEMLSKVAVPFAEFENGVTKGKSANAEVKEEAKEELADEKIADPS